MVASYSQESSIEQAFKETFGGDRPCELCKIITAVDETQQEHPLNSSESRKLTLMLGLAKAISLTVPETKVSTTLCTERRPENALTAVPTPPPRLA